jgi:large subunit ribosomal protein L3
MAAILARKLGMTQIFGEDGALARVTVLAAGPCHVTAIRTSERDGYDAVQLAFGSVREKALTKSSSAARVTGCTSAGPSMSRCSSLDST